MTASVLIIDDEPDICDVLQRLFERAGMVVHTAENGAEGLELFKETAPDLVITDIIMPEKDGLETIRELRAANENLKIIAISGGGNTGPLAYKPDAISTSAYLEAASQAGADVVMTKPFTRDEILEVVRDIGISID